MAIKFLDDHGLGTFWTKIKTLVSNKIGELTDTKTGSPGAGKTITAFSESNGKVSATFSDISITASQVTGLPSSLPASDTVQTYSASGTTPISGQGVAAALGTLDITDISNTASKTVLKITETDGKVGATFQDIAIAASQVTSGQLAIARGGTNATDAAGARTNLDVYSKSETEALLNGKVEIVNALPTTGTAGIIYYLKVGSTTGADNYEEYIWGTEPGGSTAGWIKVGEQTIDLSGYKTTQTAVSDPTASGTSLSFIATISQDANGVITPTKSSVKVTSTYSGTGTDPINGTGVKQAIDALDVSSVGGANKYISAISQTDGKISATASNLATSVTSGGADPVTAGAVYTALESYQPAMTAITDTEIGNLT